MGWFGWFVVAVLAYVAVRFVRGYSRARAFHIEDRSAETFAEMGIDRSSVMFSTYDGGDQTSVLVGIGKLSSGKDVGFAVQTDGAGVIDSFFMLPGLASHHKTIAHSARMHGIPVMEALRRRAHEKQALLPNP